MSIELEKAVDLIERAAEELFESDSTVRSVGVIRTGAGGYGFRAVRNSAIPTSLNARTLPVREVLEIPFFTPTHLAKSNRNYWFPEQVRQLLPIRVQCRK